MLLLYVCSPNSFSLQAATAATSTLSSLPTTPGVTHTTAGSWTSSAQHSAETVTSPSSGNGNPWTQTVPNHFKMSILQISQRQTILLLLCFLRWAFWVSATPKLVPTGARWFPPMWTKHCWEVASISSWSPRHTMACQHVTMIKYWKPAYSSVLTLEHWLTIRHNQGIKLL